jgi:predicted ATPase
MGLHTGPVIRLLHDFAGLNVHLASRVCTAAHGGQVVASQSVLDALSAEAGFNWADLGTHLVKDFPDPITLHQLAADGLDRTFPPLLTIDARDHNLPSLLTSFVGRADELADLRTLLSGEARLVSLTGPGGVGKTRIAIEVTWSVLSRYRGGAWFVDCAPLTDPAAIVDTIIETVGARDRDHLIASFAEAPTLLVLDHLEQLLSGAAAIAELLTACPKLVVLATTRERLRLQGEHEVVLDGLTDTDAVDLFSARAALVRRDLELDARVEQLCERVGGLPLAIELAAARLRTQSVDALLAAMDDMLATLSEGERDRPARHQAMRAAIAVSVDALTEAERAVFRAFSVFGGGATADAIGVVCAPKSDEVESLVDKSLLRRADERFTMLEPIRQFAEERLRADGPGEFEQRVQAHAQYFLDLAERLEPDLVTARQRDALDELSADHANLRLAWERAEGDAPLRLAACLTRFWASRGNPSEGRAILGRLLESHPDSDPVARAKALLGAGHLAAAQSDTESAAALLRDAIACGDAATAGAAEGLLAEVARSTGDLDGAEEHCRAALALGEQVGSDRLVALARVQQGNVAFSRRDYAAALERFREALALGEAVGDAITSMRALGNLGAALRLLAQHDDAIAALQQSLVLARTIGDRRAEGIALLNLLTVWSDQLAAREDDVPALRVPAGYGRDAIAIFEEIGAPRELAAALLAMPSFLPPEDRDEALRYIARARRVYEQLGDANGVAQADAFRDVVAGAAD